MSKTSFKFKKQKKCSKTNQKYHEKKFKTKTVNFNQIQKKIANSIYIHLASNIHDFQQGRFIINWRNYNINWKYCGIMCSVIGL